MKRVLLIVIVVVAVVMLWQLGRRWLSSDDQLIRTLITTMQRAVERNKILTLNDCIASDYTDEHGLDRSSLLAAVRATRSQYDIMFIQISDLILKINVMDQTAQAAFTVSVAGHRSGSGAKLTMDGDHVQLFFRKADDEWKLVRAVYPAIEWK
jgi:hypothetical protein